MTYRKPLSTAAVIAKRACGPIIHEADRALYRALDARIQSPRDPDAIQRHEAAREHEQRFGNAEHFGGRLAKMTFEMPPALPQFVPPLVSHDRAGNSRAVGSRTRTTGSNAKKSASGSGGADPDPERRPHGTNNSAFIGLDAASFGGAAA